MVNLKRKLTMKHLLLFAFFCFTFGLNAQSYYSCTVPTLTNVSTLSNGGTTAGDCSTDYATWNKAGGTLYIRNGSTFSLTMPNGDDLDANIVVENGGTFNLYFDYDNIAINGDILVDTGATMNITLEDGTGHHLDIEGDFIVHGTVNTLNNDANNHLHLRVDQDGAGPQSFTITGTFTA